MDYYKLSIVANTDILFHSVYFLNFLYMVLNIFKFTFIKPAETLYNNEFNKGRFK